MLIVIYIHLQTLTSAFPSSRKTICMIRGLLLRIVHRYQNEFCQAPVRSPDPATPANKNLALAIAKWCKSWMFPAVVAHWRCSVHRVFSPPLVASLAALSLWGSVTLFNVASTIGCASPPRPDATSPSAETQNARPNKRPAIIIDQPIGQCPDRSPDGNNVTDDPSRVQIEANVGVISVYADEFVELDPISRVLSHQMGRALTALSTTSPDTENDPGAKLGATTLLLVAHLDAQPPEHKPAVSSFAKQVLLHDGIVDRFTGESLPLALTPAQFQQACKRAASAGAPIDTSTNALASAMQTSTAKGPSIAKQRATLQPVSNEIITPLQNAINIANQTEKAALQPLTQYLTTQSNTDLGGYLRAATSSPSVIIGPFTSESSRFTPASGNTANVSPTSARWVGALVIADRDGQAMLDSLGETKFDFSAISDKSMSWEATQKPIKMVAITTVMAAGVVQGTDTAVLTARATDAAKTWVDLRALNAIGVAQTPWIMQGFVPPGKQASTYQSCLPQLYRAEHVLRHGVGKAYLHALAQSQTQNTAAKPGKTKMPVHTYEVIARAAEILLAHIALSTPEVLQAGLVHNSACARVAPDAFVSKYLFELRTLAAAHKDLHKNVEIQAQSLIVQGAVAQGALRQTTHDGNIYLEAQPSWSEYTKQMTKQLAAILGQSDAAAARVLIGKYATNLTPGWRQSSVKRAQKLGIPHGFVLLRPRVKPLRDNTGRIVDATLEDPMDVLEAAKSVVMEGVATGG